jgi:hypothetical protein
VRERLTEIVWWKPEYGGKPPANRDVNEAAKNIVMMDLAILPCEQCGRKDTYAHHPDYTKPLSVMWLCPIHHKLWHQRHTPIRALSVVKA